MEPYGTHQPLPNRRSQLIPPTSRSKRPNISVHRDAPHPSDVHQGHEDLGRSCWSYTYGPLSGPVKTPETVGTGTPSFWGRFCLRWIIWPWLILHHFEKTSRYCQVRKRERIIVSQTFLWVAVGGQVTVARAFLWGWKTRPNSQVFPCQIYNFKIQKRDTSQT